MKRSIVTSFVKVNPATFAFHPISIISSKASKALKLNPSTRLHLSPSPSFLSSNYSYSSSSSSCLLIHRLPRASLSSSSKSNLLRIPSIHSLSDSFPFSFSSYHSRSFSSSAPKPSPSHLNASKPSEFIQSSQTPTTAKSQTPATATATATATGSDSKSSNAQSINSSLARYIPKKLLDLIANYGKTALATYFSVYFMSIGSFYVIIHYKIFDVLGLISAYGFDQYLPNAVGSSRFVQEVGIAWVATKLVEPIRLFITVIATPKIAQIYDNYFPKPSSSENQNQKAKSITEEEQAEAKESNRKEQ